MDKSKLRFVTVKPVPLAAITPPKERARPASKKKLDELVKHFAKAPR